MSRPRKVSRRSVLAVTAASSAAFALASHADAAPRGALAATDAPPATMAELEAKAAALEPPVFLLETTVPSRFGASSGSTMTMARDVHHCGTSSLRWDYTSGAVLTVSAPLLVSPPSGGNGADIGPSVSTLAFWIYRSTPSAGTLRIEAGRGAGTDAWCELGLDFTGWRTAWIRYADMTGSPRADMDTLRFVAPEDAGTLYLDELILNTALRSNFPTPDRQVPFVNPGVRDGDNEHWLDLLWFSQLAAEPLPAPTPTAQELADLATVRSAYDAAVRKKVSVTSASVDELVAQADAFEVPGPGSPGGGRFVLGHQNVIYPAAIAADVARLSPWVTLDDYGTLMRAVAYAYGSTTDLDLKARLGDLYQRLLEHLWDQGWDDGSCQGTIHHLGYQADTVYASIWLMRDMLQDRGLLGHAKATLSWLVGMGRTRQPRDDVKRFYNGIFDIFNTTLMGMLASALLESGADRKVAQLKSVQQWIDSGCEVTPGIEDGFKPDLATFHHVGHYPAYARDGFAGGSPALVALSGTAFAASRAAHQRWNDSLLAMRFYANQTQWPLALANRHTTGTDGLKVTAYQYMTQAGSPDGTQRLDPVMGAAFLRLLPAKPSSVQKKLAAELAAAGVTAEPAPEGCQVMNHAALLSHRRDEWLVSVRGHNRYLWSTEIYPGNNEYGRYVTYGQVQVLGGGDPVTNAASGFVQPGWDWNRWPGTTAIQLPFDLLAPDASSEEEMLLCDQRIGGGGSIGGRNGAFMMSLHENAVHDGSFYARKSVFLFDNRVVALGTGIVNNDRLHRTQTTLFQCHLADPAAPTQDSRAGEIAAVPYENSAKLRAPVWLVDPQGQGYYVPAGQRLTVARTVQTAPDQGAKTEASLPYATAVLDHGTRPRRGTYEYAMVVGATGEEMSRFAADMARSDAAPYTVLRHDDTAHVVSDRATGITAHAVFEPTHNLTHTIVRAVDTASVVLVRADGADLVVSVTDPDLRCYEGPDRAAPETSPYGVPWRDAPGASHDIAIEVDGHWTCDAAGVRVRPGRGAKRTTVVVTCTNGLPTEVTLTRV